jgi:hypothetical protein
MSELQRLREEHAQLIEIVNRLSKVISQTRPPSAGELFKLRHELSSALICHLKAEDWVLYPRLLASKNPTVARKARAFSDEMGGLASAYMAYADRWPAHSIQDDWSGYCEETRDIAEALALRIKREDGELYPLLEALDKAA